MTLGIIAICIAVYLGMLVIGNEYFLIRFLITTVYSPVLPEIKSGQWWRLISPIFLHFGLFHIVFNMVWVWQLGRLIEARQGSIVLLLLILLSAIASNLLQYTVEGPVFGGMSGVVYALFGYFWIQGQTNPNFGLQLTPPIIYLMLGWFVLCWSGLLDLAFGLKVANMAHTGGLVSGIIAGFLVTWFARKKITFH